MRFFVFFSLYEARRGLGALVGSLLGVTRLVFFPHRFRPQVGRGEFLGGGMVLEWGGGLGMWEKKPGPTGRGAKKPPPGGGQVFFFFFFPADYV